jgi:hypothetical protein
MIRMAWLGSVAGNGIQEVEGSIPFGSTIRLAIKLLAHGGPQ